MGLHGGAINIQFEGISGTPSKIVFNNNVFQKNMAYFKGNAIYFKGDPEQDSKNLHDYNI